MFSIAELCELLRPWFKRWVIHTELTSDVWIELCFIFCISFLTISLHISPLFISHRPHYRLPFNWRTPLGYLVAELSEMVSIVSIVHIFTPTMGFYVGSCWLFIIFVRDITKDLQLLNVGSASERNYKKMSERFGHAIQLHSDLKQLVCPKNYYF